MAVWSGDRVKRNADGLLYFVGRRDAMIKSAGNVISPQEIEEAALATGLVSEAVALGLPDERLGQAVHLVVRAAPPPERALRIGELVGGRGGDPLHEPAPPSYDMPVMGSGGYGAPPPQHGNYNNPWDSHY